ncbi:PREDICTED: uncharacterized protein LOC109127205 [Camelina sativa]|uniref:Uncharacterized protein LOC109127205 n=1 Tax=Camelina sativa TaxID=90675 RepID=A0ABM1QKH3_CAMSA|nr:PREDICTED: uncharacterized protein LOC109127205 [Camelina sativa]
MAAKFEMSDLGRLTYYLGIEVNQYEGGIMLKQERYAERILEEAGMRKCNVVFTPMESGLKMSKAQEEAGIEERVYRRNIGCLRYLLHTRPDLSFCVGVLSRYMHESKTSHGAALKQILRYLRGTTSYGLNYTRSKKTGLVGYSEISRSRLDEAGLVDYSDSSHNVDEDDGKSTTGHVFYLNQCPITWCSQKQETVAMSSCKAEFMAATEAAKQAIWLQELLGEITGQESEKVVIQIDNKSTIALTKNPVFHGRMEVEHVPGSEQKADILTKALGRIKFTEMRNLVGIKDISKEKINLKGENVSLNLKDKQN